MNESLLLWQCIYIDSKKNTNWFVHVILSALIKIGMSCQKTLALFQKGYIKAECIPTIKFPFPRAFNSTTFLIFHLTIIVATNNILVYRSTRVNTAIDDISCCV